MVDYAAEFRRCLVDLDVVTARRLWQHVQPDLPQPRDDHETLITLHAARTASAALPLRARAFSHRFLVDHGLPSMLPDHLKPQAEREYPVVAAAVGISVNARSEMLQPVVPLVRSAMEHAVLEAFADGHQDQPAVVSARMKEARTRTIKKLIGV